MASARYTLVSAKSKWEEELGWFRFDQQPPRANYNCVIEFYANNANGEDFSVVRGRRVPATTTIINEIFGLPNNAPSFYAMLEGFEEEDYEVIKNLLCQPNTEWNTTGRNPYSVSKLSLLPEAKLWNTFVKRNLMPTSHNQTVDRTRLLLINTIMTGFRVNVVSTLCRRVSTPMFDTDKYQPQKDGWTRAVYMRKMNVADAEPLNMAMPTPPASPVNEADARVEDSAPPPPSPPVIPVSSHTTTTNPATTPAEQTWGRTAETPLGSTPSNPAPSPSTPAQSEEAGSLQYMLLRSQLQRIEAR
ncbi:hypothetical protein V6N11_051047 [Hibiscus sabdariffa]|uniref:Putative plant transposon protein domain-containing protein n=1 Tax=Hibiscus sabdariffa TaxID=183260 RepID=A0ABR2R2P7_9ROSI